MEGETVLIISDVTMCRAVAHYLNASELKRPHLVVSVRELISKDDEEPTFEITLNEQTGLTDTEFQEHIMGTGIISKEEAIEKIKHPT